MFFLLFHFCLGKGFTEHFPGKCLDDQNMHGNDLMIDSREPRMDLPGNGLALPGTLHPSQDFR
jgi:hypothetical protein